MLFFSLLTSEEHFCPKIKFPVSTHCVCVCVCVCFAFIQVVVKRHVVTVCCVVCYSPSHRARGPVIQSPRDLLDTQIINLRTKSDTVHAEYTEVGFRSLEMALSNGHRFALLGPAMNDNL